MNAFSDLAVLSVPTTENKDWSFILGDLQFEVHESVVELTSQIKSFESFAKSIDALDALLENIESNRGRLDKRVYDFVNQNNELAQALGIIMPYSFATEEEQQQAGNDVKEAAEGDGENQGFFARAWEGIKKFFRAIKDALSKAWNAITNKSKAEDDQNAAANQALESMHPAEVQKALEAAFDQAGKVYVTLDDATKMAADIVAISNHCRSIGQQFGNPMQFFNYLDQLNGTFLTAFEPVKRQLGNIGITLIDKNINGNHVIEVQKTGKTIYDITPEKLKTARDAFIGNNGDRAISYAQKFIGKQGSVRVQVKEAIQPLDDLIKNINNLLGEFEKEQVIAEITKKIEGGKFMQWLRKVANATEAKKRIEIAKAIGQNVSKALSVIMTVVKEADGKIMSTCKAIDAQILLRNKRADNKDVQELKERRETFATNKEAQTAKDDASKYHAVKDNAAQYEREQERVDDN